MTTLAQATFFARFEPILLVWLCCVGACVGSFLNVVIFRLPRRCLSVFRPSRSFCPLCRHAIRWYENLPIVSWLLILRGRCGGCEQKISARYPAVELAVTLLFGFLAWRMLPGEWHRPEVWGHYAVLCVFGCSLLACALIDYDLRVLPDVIDVPWIVAGPLLLCLLPGMLGTNLPNLGAWAASTLVHLESPFQAWGLTWLLAPAESLVALNTSDPGALRHASGLVGGVLGAAVGGGFLWAGRTLFMPLFGRDAIGMGDVKYLAMIGGLTGWQGALLALLIASFSGSVLGLLLLLKRREGSLATASLPLGPFLSLGGFVAALAPLFPRQRLIP